MPPPSVSPASPVWVTIPAGTASPNACVSRSSSPEQHAGLGPRRARLGIDPDPLHRAQVDDDAAVADREAGEAVAAAADGDREAGAPSRTSRPRSRRRRRRSARSAPGSGRSTRSRPCGARRRLGSPGRTSCPPKDRFELAQGRLIELDIGGDRAHAVLPSLPSCQISTCAEPTRTTLSRTASRNRPRQTPLAARNPATSPAQREGSSA